MLDHLMGGEIAARVPAGTDMNAAMGNLTKELTAQGRKPYVIPGGGSNPIGALGYVARSEEHTSELQSLMRSSYAVFCLKKKNNYIPTYHTPQHIRKVTMTYT